MATQTLRRPIGRWLSGMALALALLASLPDTREALAQPAAEGDLGGEIGTLDTQTALHLSPDDVVALRKTLIRLGLLTGDADGGFDDQTQAALAAWQKAHGLAPTGRLAPLQWAELRGSSDERAAAWREEIGAADTEAALALGASDIATMQTTLLRLRILRQAPTGAFDENTRRALAFWQRRAGYAPTGHLGPRQWASLREAAPLAPNLEDVQHELGTVYGEAGLGLTPGEIMTVQDRLCAARDLHGPIGGEFDEATRAALIAWQKGELVTPTGYLGPLQFDALLASTPRSPDGVLATPCSGAEVAAPSAAPAPTLKASPRPRIQMARLHRRRAHPWQENPFAFFFQGFGRGFGQVLAQRSW